MDQAFLRASLVAQMVKNLCARQETQVQSLSQEDPLEKGMATYSSILAWRIPWTEEPGGLCYRNLILSFLANTDVVIISTSDKDVGLW